MAPGGGAFGRLLPIIKAGVGGQIGDGRMWWPWITLLDEVRAIEYLLEADVSGPVNLGSPNPARNADVTRRLRRGVPPPHGAAGADLRAAGRARGVLQDVTGSQRMVPQVLSGRRLRLRPPDLHSAARWLAEQ